MHHRRVQDSPSDTPPQEVPWKSDRTPSGWQQRDWEQDRERLKHLQKRAGETVRSSLVTPLSPHIIPGR